MTRNQMDVIERELMNIAHYPDLEERVHRLKSWFAQHVIEVGAQADIAMRTLREAGPSGRDQLIAHYRSACFSHIRGQLFNDAGRLLVSDEFIDWKQLHESITFKCYVLGLRH